MYSISCSDVRSGLFDQREAGVDHLAQVVRRDVGGHADGDAARAVDQHVREARGQDRRLAVLAVVIVLEIDGFLVDIGQQVGCRLVHAHLGIAHGRGVVAVHRAEIALTVEQRQRHREILRHPHQRVVDRAVAVRVVLAHHVAHGTRRLAVGLVVRVAGLVHRVEDAPVHRFQPVAQVGDRPAHDHAHRVIEIATIFISSGDRDRGASRRLRVVARNFVFVFRGFRRIVHVRVPPMPVLYLVGSAYTRARIWGAMAARPSRLAAEAREWLTHCFC